MKPTIINALPFMHRMLVIFNLRINISVIQQPPPLSEVSNIDVPWVKIVVTSLSQYR